MGKIKDWAKCSIKNRFTLSGLLTFPPAFASIVYFSSNGEKIGTLIGGLSLAYATVAMMITSLGMDTYDSYVSARKIISRRGHLPDFVRPCSYCDRKGIELAIEEAERNK